MTKKESYKSKLFIATHVAQAHGPQYVLKELLEKAKVPFAYAAFPFDYAKIANANLTVQHPDASVVESPGHKNNSHGVMSWIKDGWTLWRWGNRAVAPDGVFIGINNLNTSIGILLKWLGKCTHVIYYVIDYTPTRFSNPVLNWIYQALAKFSAKHADMVWSLSEPMQQVHRQFGAKNETNIIVPIGIDFDEVKVIPEKEIKRNKLVVISTLFESKGIQLVIQAMGQLPEARLTIVGTGPYENVLKKLAKTGGVADRIQFRGLLSRQELVDELANSVAAIAPYQNDPSNYSYYADPAKPKEYLACGIPVIITKVPWIASLIDSRPMGLAIDYDVDQLADACRQLMRDADFWTTCRKQALDYMKDYSWRKIFNQALNAYQTQVAGVLDEPYQL